MLGCFCTSNLDSLEFAICFKFFFCSISAKWQELDIVAHIAPLSIQLTAVSCIIMLCLKLSSSLTSKYNQEVETIDPLCLLCYPTYLSLKWPDGSSLPVDWQRTKLHKKMQITCDKERRTSVSLQCSLKHKTKHQSVSLRHSTANTLVKRFPYKLWTTSEPLLCAAKLAPEFCNLPQWQLTYDSVQNVKMPLQQRQCRCIRLASASSSPCKWAVFPKIALKPEHSGAVLTEFVAVTNQDLPSELAALIIQTALAVQHFLG